MTEVDRGREAFASAEWALARDCFRSADAEHPLGPQDLVLAGQVAVLLGDDAAAPDLFARAHRAFLATGDGEHAALCAFWLGMHLVNRGELAPGSGWFARTHRLLADGGGDWVVAGYLMVPEGWRALAEGRLDAAADLFARASVVGERFREPDLVALARVGHGNVLIASGHPREGVALLDESMVSVTAGELTPITTGVVYCTVIDVCQRALDVRRAQEWTTALEQWWASQPGLVPFTGACLVHRAHISRLHGDWSQALAEATDACERLTRNDPRAAATGFVEIGELRCLRGETDLADEAFRRAAALGRDPEPSLSLLLLAQGRPEAAAAAISRVLADPAHPADRASVLAAAVEILLAAGDVGSARRAADELTEVAGARATSWLDGLSADATGAVLLAEGEPGRALPALRRARSVWLELGAPYEGARTQVQVARALEALGDEDAARRERDAAAATFERLGAAPPSSVAPAGGLTGREVEVLALVATGLSNRAIAEQLVLSEKTVARHLSNIFVKIDVHSRAAAGRWAHTHGVVRAG